MKQQKALQWKKTLRVILNEIWRHSKTKYDVLVALISTQSCPQCNSYFMLCYRDSECRRTVDELPKCAKQQGCNIPMENNNKQWSDCYKNQCSYLEHPKYTAFDNCIVERCVYLN
ncbi:hypothetical protein PPERSA_04349 [Pseudocohnilembus persalinus]|uniref:Uncharacterized protein n=1 Tax=Pseudocohnilembus persalinus TaxID=266149 RepID=A0A0V0QQL4_PSEPJ|nr:hypothetical protein PPERSA_04349 [Pseudocohnilembus persalinus]|eukprot:KRX04534.1 hypothetical protein PPERSA_04349 [Pseudocohnilembus persalinus]